MSKVANDNAGYGEEKKIIISFDGTGGEPSWGNQEKEEGPVGKALSYFGLSNKKMEVVGPNASGLSNISKMHLLLGGDLQNSGNLFKDQIPLYYSGVGTRREGVFAKTKSTIKSAINLGSMTDIYNEALEDLEKCYKEGDELYMFGFSRGAATARLFCSYLQRHGLKVGGKKINPKITFLGVYDTVPAAINRGISNTGRYQLDVNYDSWSTFWQTETNMPEIVEKAVHLVAVDEQRFLFRPTLFNKDKRVTEIWCAGNHSDVGGGYYHDGLSDGTLTYMLKALGGSFSEKEGFKEGCLKYRTITDTTVNNWESFVGPGGNKDVVNFDKDMDINPVPCDKYVHNENAIYYEVVNQLKSFESRNIVQFKNDVELHNEPILVLDNVIDRVKDVNKELKEPYRPLNLMGKAYNKVNSKTGIISDKVYRIVNSVNGTISEEERVNLNGTKQSWIKRE